MSVYKRGSHWWYGFWFDKRRIQKSTRQTSRKIAMNMEAAHRIVLAKNRAGIDTTPEEELEKHPRVSPAPKSAYVYLLEGEHGYHKIGVTWSVEQRLKDIQSAVPFKVKVLHSFRSRDALKAEFELHLRFDAKRRNGEWFALSPEDVAHVRSMAGDRCNEPLEQE
jgi:hypothetical protein